MRLLCLFAAVALTVACNQPDVADAATGDYLAAIHVLDAATGKCIKVSPGEYGSLVVDAPSACHPAP